MSTSSRTIRWIEDLAEQEILISNGQRTSIDLGKTKDQVWSAGGPLESVALR